MWETETSSLARWVMIRTPVCCSPVWSSSLSPSCLGKGQWFLDYQSRRVFFFFLKFLGWSVPVFPDFKVYIVFTTSKFFPVDVCFWKCLQSFHFVLKLLVKQPFFIGLFFFSPRVRNPGWVFMTLSLAHFQLPKSSQPSRVLGIEKHSEWLHLVQYFENSGQIVILWV